MVQHRKLRIAPTPSGYLHLGNAFNFLLIAKTARLLKAELLLRIDDIDNTRSRVEYIADILDTINWLQIPITQGPSTVTEFEQHWSQFHRMDIYISYYNALKVQDILFACACTRTQLKTASPNRGCVQNCALKNIPPGTPDTAAKARINTDEHIPLRDQWTGLQDLPVGENPGCFTVWRKENVPSYQLCSLADDVHFNITDIIRGEDLLNSTAAQYWLAQKLHLSQFMECRFYHHPLLCEPSGIKLSKSAGAYSLKEMRAKGVTANELNERFNEWFHSLPGLSSHL